MNSNRNNIFATVIFYVCHQPEWLENGGTLRIIQATNEKHAADQMAGLKVSSLIIASHGDYDFAYFNIGVGVYRTPEEISGSSQLARIAKTLTIDAEIIFTACNLGATDNGGLCLLDAAATKFKRTVYGNQSFTPGRRNLFLEVKIHLHIILTRR